jgi:hypothetical protein
MRRETEREREREREKETETGTDRERQRETHRERNGTMRKNSSWVAKHVQLLASGSEVRVGKWLQRHWVGL